MFVISITFISCGMFGYALNLIGEQIKELGRDKLFFKRKMIQLNKYMSQRFLS
jgi:hypothetical protein